MTDFFYRFGQFFTASASCQRWRLPETKVKFVIPDLVSKQSERRVSGILCVCFGVR
jgi:hypothetical protein